MYYESIDDVSFQSLKYLELRAPANKNTYLHVHIEELGIHPGINGVAINANGDISLQAHALRLGILRRVQQLLVQMEPDGEKRLVKKLFSNYNRILQYPCKQISQLTKQNVYYILNEEVYCQVVIVSRLGVSEGPHLVDSHALVLAPLREIGGLEQVTHVRKGGVR